MPVQDEAEDGRRDQEQREEREEAVVGDRRREVAALVVGVLLAHGQRKAEPAMPLLEAVEGPVPLGESWHAQATLDVFALVRSIRV